MASNWNAYVDRLLAADLTTAELRLALALMRLTLGYRRTERRLGRVLLCETAGGMDVRTFWRARQTLVAKGLLRYESTGVGGRGKRSLYALDLDTKVRPGAAVSADPKVLRSDAKSAAPAQPRIGKRIGKTSPASPENAAQSTAEIELRRRAFDAYLGGGGTLTLDRERDVLARQVTLLLRADVDERSILAACRECGQRHEFPGWVNQRARALAADGGPCQWDGIGRSQLTVPQLSECGCRRCQTWIAHRAAEVDG